MVRAISSRLRWQLFLVVALAILPALWLIFQLNIQQRRMGRELVKKQMEALTEKIRSQQENYIENAHQLLGYLGTIPDLKGRDTEKLSRYFHMLLKRFPVYSNIGMTLRDGTVVASGIPMERPTNFSDREWHRRALRSRQFTVSRYLVGRITGVPSIVCIEPLLDETKTVQALIFASIDLSWLSNGISQADLPPDAVVNIIDGAGNLLTQFPDSEESLKKKSWGDQSGFREMAGQSMFLEHTCPDGLPRLHMSVLLSPGFDTGIYVLLSTPTEAIYADANRAMRRNLVFLMLAVSMAGLVTWWLGTAVILNPAQKLLEATHRVKKGDLTFRSGPPYGRGVFGILAKAFDNMRESLMQTDLMRREAQESLAQKERFFRSLIENAWDVMTVIKQDGTIVYESPSIQRVLGWEPGELLGKNVSDLVHPDDLPSVMKAIASARLDRQAPPIVLEYRFRQKDGSWRHMEGMGKLTKDPSGEIMGFVNSHDVGERKAAQYERIARQAAEAANRAKSVFVANISHEIRTPLNAIIGFAQILERDRSLTVKQTDKARAITRGGRHLLGLINDILDMSKIEAGQLVLNTAPFSLHDLLDDLEMMFRPQAEVKGLRLLVERQESVLRYMSGDEGKLRQVLVNLMGNAVKFTHTGGVAVRIRADKDGEEEGFLRLLVEVEDTGPGIAEEDMGHLFDAFWQSKRGREIGGTGLGLPITRRLIELMGGTMTVESQEGKGSVFRFHVAVKPAEAAAERPIKDVRAIVGLEPGAGLFRILVVDDQKDNRDLLIALLAPLGFDLREAADGQEALEVFEHWSPHAVLMDMRMPVMDGYEATRRMKASSKGRKTAIIAVTASAFEDDEEEVRATGVDGYVRKPFRPEELFDALGKCLDVRYVYAQEGAKTRGKPMPVTREDLASLSGELVDAMRQAVEQGDMARLKELIRQVEGSDRHVAKGLMALANQYEYEKLMDVFGKVAS